MRPPAERARIGLRARVAIGFGLGAFLLSALLSAVTYGLVRENLVSARERRAVAVTVRNALQAERRITDATGDLDVRQLLSDLGTDSTPVLRFDATWFSANPAVFSGPDNIDADLLGLVADGTPARMRYRLDTGEAFLVTGTLLNVPDAVYFEAAPLADIEDTLNSIGLSLFAGGAITTLAGIGVGAWASRRVLRPLVEASETARAIAAGDLGARLEAEADPDLATLANSFNHMASNLEDRIERDAEFASNVSHELRSPLMTITASLEILESRRYELSERSQTALDLLSTDLERFRQLVTDLLEISRYDVQAHRLDFDHFGVVEFVRRVVHDAKADRLRLTYPPDAESVVIEADKRRLARVITNLLQNADNYAGGATEVTIEIIGDDLRIAVIDDGPGVPPAERQTIFERFARGAEGGRRGAGTGTGLGLALAAEHVRLHGGALVVQDRPDGQPGGCFVLDLPGVVR